MEQNQNAITGTLSTCDWIGPGNFTATLAGDQLLNVSLSLDGEVCIATGTGSVSGGSMTLTLADPACDGGLSFTATLAKDVNPCH